LIEDEQQQLSKTRPLNLLTNKNLRIVTIENSGVRKMPCHYCQQMRRRMLTAFRVKRFIPSRGHIVKVAVTQPPQVKDGGGSSPSVRTPKPRIGYSPWVSGY
jgi:hypothetical protein